MKYRQGASTEIRWHVRDDYPMDAVDGFGEVFGIHESEARFYLKLAPCPHSSFIYFQYPTYLGVLPK